MTKDITSIRIDSDIKQRAKEKGLNISAEVERALKEKLFSTKNDLPEEKLIVKCGKCGKEINEGYFCKESHKIWCKECHAKVNMEKECYPYYQEMTYPNKKGTYISHEHIFWRERLNHRPIGEEGFIDVKDEYHEDRNQKYEWIQEKNQDGRYLEK